jgi:hypothetical protein
MVSEQSFVNVLKNQAEKNEATYGTGVASDTREN